MACLLGGFFLFFLKIRNIFLVLFFASFFSLCANFQTIYASDNDLNDQIKNAIDAANDLKLSETRDWKLILYYYNSWLGEKSLIDDSNFFLSPHGKLDPNLEMIETIKALYKPKENMPEIELAQCRFPMRTAWLSRKLASKNVIFPKVRCEELENFISFVNPQGLTLLFSSFYPNNPGSLFGHTLLRVNSKSSLQNRSSTNLLDLGVGFAARPTTNNPFLYLLNGLFGGFTGRFDFNPFYIKVQEYNHSENRDLWEYDLNYTPEQVTDILRSLFEVRLANIDYYYFDDNCAFILLHLLEIGRPDFDLKGKFNSWIIPGDTLRIVALEPGLVNRIQYRPSVFRSFLELQKSLSDAEKKLLESLVERKLSPNEIKLDTLRKILLLDTFLEYIDFDERLAGSKEAIKWAIPRKEALVARAQLGQIGRAHV